MCVFRPSATDQLRSYGNTHRELILEAIHSTKQYENNRAEQSQSLPRFTGMRQQEYGSGA
ncbi:hypothetical protein KT71_08495 [Congregibacter litoralis KT71]|uniref:Uncharacterized protein n=1 Tax=Congregibacter litoralis KT71 TaxID=314285 RepID=A4AD28_9GAMM|nr:hypothetical protein KT71_08495 [Congregibacter litoralis KT71]